MTSNQIRQSFVDFFKSKQHTIVPSSSLMPDAPNLLFTNAGMNQFVPIFLGQQKCPYNPPRAADTQKCIRAGGKHNDLEDVGLDTYHHTFFEMLGNWSFGDYFKKEAIEWAWELVTEIWKFPKDRLYATVYNPDKSKKDPSDFDQEAYDHWARLFTAAGLDPKTHIINGNKKDNFWMMGETGPCGPCSELHVDLTPEGDTKGFLVNKGDARCIEIWNLVFIQFNANPDGTFSPLPARHVDTGMGFERVTSIIQGTKGFSDFKNAKISNYETDIFLPIFGTLERVSGKKYRGTLPQPGSLGGSNQERIDIAFRAIADHIRALTCAIADGIEPGNDNRNYVLRKMLRRAVWPFGRELGFVGPFLFEIVDVVAEQFGSVFPEIIERKEHVKSVIRREEESFSRTVDEGVRYFQQTLAEIEGIQRFIHEAPSKLEELRLELKNTIPDTFPVKRNMIEGLWAEFLSGVGAGPMNDKFLADLSHAAEQGQMSAVKAKLITLKWTLAFKKLCLPVNELMAALLQTTDWAHSFDGCRKDLVAELSNLEKKLPSLLDGLKILPGEVAYDLLRTYGLPVDVVQREASRYGLTVDMLKFEEAREADRALSRASQKKQTIGLAVADTSTKFVGYESLISSALVVNTHEIAGKSFAIVDRSPLYAEMGGQVGDTGTMFGEGRIFKILNTIKKGDAFYLQIDQPLSLPVNDPRREVFVELNVDKARREAIQRHHTVTHLLHWALHEVVSKDATQKGSYVGPEKLTFDFNNAPLTPQQVADIEKLVNERILENAAVSWIERPYSEIKARKDILQFFGEKYGDTVRVVQIGGQAKALNGYSMELCGGTHTRATGEIGLFRIVGENAIAAGVRRIEAVAGLEAYSLANQQLQLIRGIAGRINSPVHELEKKIESLVEHQKQLEKQLKASQQKQAAETARTLIAKAQTIGSSRAIIENLGPADGDYLQSIADSLKGQFKGVVVLGGVANNAVSLVAAVSPDLTSKIQAGKIIQAIAPIVGGKGGGKPDNARGGGKDASKLDEALAKVRDLIT